jgi:hypothetical protein
MIFAQNGINVRYWMNNGKQMLDSSFSGLDPDRTPSAWTFAQKSLRSG